ncbi:MAG TPA: class I tRNA ligase family protein, partial [Gemmatales bacterium]|nr:class I tRNA ligase family protein [Gemmatales bacterium]
YFMRECPFPGDGDFSWDRFKEVFNSELANNLGNLLSRCLTLITKNYQGILPGTAGKPVLQDGCLQTVPGLNLAAFVEEVRSHVEACRYNQ